MPSNDPQRPYLVCGPSNCFAQEPENWIDHWRHNDLFVFDNLERVANVLPSNGADSFLRLGLRTLPVQFGTIREGWQLGWDVEKVTPAPIPAGFVRLGYDVCCRSAQSALECSPIVCNGYADELHANRYCLLDTLAQAIAAAERFAAEGVAEPGPYVVLEIWAERDPLGDSVPPASTT
jgi:hypothetical protein